MTSPIDYERARVLKLQSEIYRLKLKIERLRKSRKQTEANKNKQKI